MNLNGTSSSTAKSSGFKPDKHSPLSKDEKTSSARVSSPALRERLQQFKPGTTGQPGKIAGSFQSLYHQPQESTAKLVSEIPKPYAVEAPPPNDIGQKIQLAIDAEIAAFPYHRSLDKISQATQLPENHTEVDPEVGKHLNFGQWDTARPLALAAGNAAGLSTKGSEGFIYDKKSGLTAYILHNPTSVPKPEVRLVFGGTTSGKATGGLVKRSLSNRGFTLRQWIANAKNALLGKAPDSYKQASELTQKVQSLMAADPKYKDYTFSVSGHSKGGGEAAYAALSQKEPVHAICFSSAELGRKLRESIPEERKANAAAHVQHYYIEGDAVPNMSDNLLIRKTGGKIEHIGKVTTLPADREASNSLDRHDKFTRHIHYFAKSG